MVLFKHPPPLALLTVCTTDGVVAEWSKVLTAVPLPFMGSPTLALGTYYLRFISWVFHVIFSFVHFISLYTLGGLCAFRKPLPYNMYVFNLRIANHILIIKKKKDNKDITHEKNQLQVAWKWFHLQFTGRLVSEIPAAQIIQST